MIDPLKAASLRTEWGARARTLNANVAELAELLPTRLFKMRVLTTKRATLPPIVAWALLTMAYIVMAVPFGMIFGGIEYLILGGCLSIPLFLITGVAHALDVRVPLPWKEHAAVYVRNGNLATVPMGYESLSTSWTERTCTQLLNEEGIVLSSLLAELERGVNTYFARIEVLDEGVDAAQTHVQRARERASIQAEVSPVQVARLRA